MRRPATRLGRLGLRSGILAAGLAASAGLAALGLAEASLRALGLYAPVAHHVMEPLVTRRDLQTGWDVSYTSNSLGLRGPEHPFGGPPAGELRILTIGDSFAFGQGVRLEESFPQVLEAWLRGEGHPAEVINLSRIGAGPESYYVMLREIGLRYRPDLVVVNVFGNDASSDVTPTPSRRLLRRLSHHLHLVSLLRMLNQARANSRNAEATADPERYWSRLVAECERHQPPAACSASVEAFRERHGSRLNNLVSVCLTDPAEVRRWVYTDTRGPGWRELASYLRAMVALCQGQGCRLVLGVIPDAVQVDRSQLELRRSLFVDYPDSVLTGAGAFQAAVAELAGRLGVAAFDPLAEMRASAEPLYFDADLHWTPAGHRRYAEALGEFLLAGGLLPGTGGRRR